MIKLFSTLKRHDWFSFGDKPERLLLKSDQNHYVGPEGRHRIDPNVAVIPRGLAVKTRKSIFDLTKGKD